MAVIQKDKENTMKLLKKAALDVFSARGFDKGTTKEIALKAKVNETLITRYFGSKDGLFHALVLDYIRSRVEVHCTYPAQDSLEKEIEEYSRMILSEAFSNVKLFKAMYVKFIVDKKLVKEVNKLCADTKSDFQNRILTLQNAGKVSKELNPFQIDWDIQLLVSANFLFVHVMDNQDKGLVLNEALRQIRVYTRGLK